MLIPIGFVMALVAILFHVYELLPISIVISGAGALLGIFFAVPVVMIGVVFLLTPVVVYFFADDRSYPILHAWWYWVGCVFCVCVWVWTLIDAERRYPRKSAALKKEPNQSTTDNSGAAPRRV